MPNLYIIAGCKGAGKTTASFTVLPEMLDCYDFINADEIARGLSPLNPDKASIDAGRLMLERINKLLLLKKDFAFETTLATRSYLKTIEKAANEAYLVTMIFNNSNSPATLIAEGYKDLDYEIKNISNFETLKKYAGYDKK